MANRTIPALQEELNTLERFFKTDTYVDFITVYRAELDQLTATIFDFTPQTLGDMATRERQLGVASQLKDSLEFFADRASILRQTIAESNKDNQ